MPPKPARDWPASQVAAEGEALRVARATAAAGYKIRSRHGQHGERIFIKAASCRRAFCAARFNISATVFVQPAGDAGLRKFVEIPARTRTAEGPALIKRMENCWR